MTTAFIIMRFEGGGYSGRGPIAAPMTLEEAREEIRRLKGQYPHQDFRLLGEVGTATKSERVNVKITAPPLGEKKRKAAPVVQLVQKEAKR